MANLGKKWTCFQCGTKFYDFMKPEALCPKCQANQKDAPSRPKAPKKEKVALAIEDDYHAETETDLVVDEDGGLEEALGIPGARPDGVDPGDLNMDDYDE